MSVKHGEIPAESTLHSNGLRSTNPQPNVRGANIIQRRSDRKAKNPGIPLLGLKMKPDIRVGLPLVTELSFTHAGSLVAQRGAWPARPSSRHTEAAHSYSKNLFPVKQMVSLYIQEHHPVRWEFMLHLCVHLTATRLTLITYVGGPSHLLSFQPAARRN